MLWFAYLSLPGSQLSIGLSIEIRDLPSSLRNISEDHQEFDVLSAVSHEWKYSFRISSL